MALLDRFKKKKKVEKKIKEKPVEKKADLKVPKKKIISAYQIIKNPHITEKASFLSEKNKYIFKIFPKANKTEIKKAIESLYDVKVEQVHIIHSAAKKRRLGKSQGFRHGLKKGFKKAIVTLKQGDKIELAPR